LDILNEELISDHNEYDNNKTTETNYKIVKFTNPQNLHFQETNKQLLTENIKDDITNTQGLVREQNLSDSECLYTNLFERYLLIIFFTMYEFPLFYKLIKLKKNKIKF
jgi:hypothetical protein